MKMRNYERDLIFHSFYLFAKINIYW